MENIKRIPTKDVYGFVSGEFFRSFVIQTALSYFAFFLTNVAMVPAVLLGTVLLVSQIVDFFSASTAGLIIEKVPYKKVKYSKWLMIAPVIMAVCFSLLFTKVDLPEGLKVVYYAGFYILAFWAYNLLFTSLLSTVSTIAKDPDDRSLMSSRIMTVSFAAKIIWSLATMPLILLLGGPDGGRGYSMVMLIFTVLMVIVYWLVPYRIGKRYEESISDAEQKGNNAPPRQKVTFKEMVNAVVQSKPLGLIMFADTLRSVAFFAVSGLAVYYFRYVINNINLSSIFFFAINIATVLGTLILPSISKKLGKKTTYITFVAFQAACLLVARFIAKDAVTFISLMALANLATGALQGLAPSMYVDITDYAEWKTGKSAKSVIMSMYNTVPKMAMLIGSSVITGFGLAAIGYSPNVEASPELAAGIGNLMLLIPGVITVLSLVSLFFYDLTKEKVLEMQKEIAARKEASQA